MSWVLAGVSVATAVGGAAYSSSQNKKAQAKADAQRKKDAQATAAYSKSSAKSSKMEEHEAPEVNYLQTGRDAMTLAGEAYPFFLGLNQKYGADYARNEVDVAAARSKAQEGVISKQGLGLRESLLGASPEISAANDSVMAGLKATGPSALETELNGQALTDLKLGGTLSNEDTRAAVQQARAGSSARGMANGQSGLVAEVLNRQGFADARRNERRGFASAIDAQSTQRRASDAAITNNAFNTLGSFWDPQQRIFGSGGSAVSGQVAGPSQFQGYLNGAINVAQGNQQANSLNNQLNQEGQQFGINRADSLFLSQLNSNTSLQNAAANRAAANNNAWIGAAGQIGSAAWQAYL